jgi:hypothetical protein
MDNEMVNRHNLTKYLKLVVSSCFILALSACSSNDDTVATAETVTEIPQFIQKFTLNTADPDASLLAWITIDSGTRNPMTIDSAAGTESTSIPGLSRTTHSVLIEFEFTDGIDTITLATVTSTVDLSSGDASLSFADTDYTTSFDNDGDGINNVTEIINGTDPLVPAVTNCILDTSVIGGCTLG